jgi:hypothetical protein
MSAPALAVVAQIIVALASLGIARWSRRVTADSWPTAMPLEWREARARSCRRTGRLCYAIAAIVLGATVVTIVQTHLL